MQFTPIQTNSTENFRYQQTFRLKGGNIEEPTQPIQDGFSARQEYEKACLLHTKLSRLNAEVSSLVGGAASLDQVRKAKPSPEAESSVPDAATSETPVWGRDEMPLSGQVHLREDNHLGIGGFLYFDPDKLEAGIGDYGALASGSFSDGELQKSTGEMTSRQIHIRKESEGHCFLGNTETTEFLFQNRRAGRFPQWLPFGPVIPGEAPQLTATDKIVVNHKSDTITLLANSLE